MPSNVEGHFWINSAELHAGPIVWGEPESPPNNGLTGIMRSREFTIGADYMVLRVGGGNDSPSRRATVPAILSAMLGKLFRGLFSRRPVLVKGGAAV